MKQKKDKAETAKAIFSKENLGFINEPDLVETSKLRLNALANVMGLIFLHKKPWFMIYKGFLVIVYHDAHFLTRLYRCGTS